MNIRSNPATTLAAVTTAPLPSSPKIFVTPDEAPDLRVLPSVLDLAAAFGSDFALAIQDEAGVTDYVNYPEQMQAALERHDAILRAVIGAHGGYVFSTAGDSFAAAFGRAGDAVECLLALRNGDEGDLPLSASTV